MNRDIAGDTPKSPVEAGKGFRGEFFGIEVLLLLLVGFLLRII